VNNKNKELIKVSEQVEKITRRSRRVRICTR